MGGRKWSAFFWSRRNYDFVGDGRNWAPDAISRLNMESKSILLLFFFDFLNHGKNITEKPIDLYAMKVEKVTLCKVFR